LPVPVVLGLAILVLIATLGVVALAVPLTTLRILLLRTALCFGLLP
jgi:hypothetical protein